MSRFAAKNAAFFGKDKADILIAGESMEDV
jgi:Leucine-rich repeat (LRR) protein